MVLALLFGSHSLDRKRTKTHPTHWCWYIHAAHKLLRCGKRQLDVYHQSVRLCANDSNNNNRRRNARFCQSWWMCACPSVWICLLAIFVWFLLELSADTKNTEEPTKRFVVSIMRAFIAHGVFYVWIVICFFSQYQTPLLFMLTMIFL